MTPWAEADDSSKRSARRQRPKPCRVPESSHRSSSYPRPPELGTSHQWGQDRAGCPAAHPQLVGEVWSNKQRREFLVKKKRYTRGAAFLGKGQPRRPQAAPPDLCGTCGMCGWVPCNGRGQPQEADNMESCIPLIP